MVRYRSLTFLGYPKHRVGDDGSVWSCCNNRWGIGKWRRLSLGSRGETAVLSRSAADIKFLSVSRLVLTAFVGPCPEGMEACHFPDPNRRNNTLVNLRWDTHKANERDKIAHGTYQYGERNPLATLTKRQVAEMRMLRRNESVPYKKLAERFGVATMTAWNICNGKTWNDARVSVDPQ